MNREVGGASKAGDRMMRLNAATIRKIKLPPGVIDKVYFDEDMPGFGLRVRASGVHSWICLLYTSPSPRDGLLSRMPSSA